MAKTIEDRIAAMARRDTVTAITFTIAMWAALAFTFLMVRSVAPTGSVALALGLAFLALGGINTASLLAMVRRYAAERDFIYREDLFHLDSKRTQRAEKRI